jgi:hypothetical protein
VDDRDPAQSLLYQTIASNLETFLAWRQQRGRPIPGFVEEEFRAFLECGVLEYGFLRLRCQTCGRDRLLAFSCKGRGGVKSMLELQKTLSNRAFFADFSAISFLQLQTQARRFQKARPRNDSRIKIGNFGDPRSGLSPTGS